MARSLVMAGETRSMRRTRDVGPSLRHLRSPWSRPRRPTTNSLYSQWRDSPPRKCSRFLEVFGSVVVAAVLADSTRYLW